MLIIQEYSMQHHSDVNVICLEDGSEIHMSDWNGVKYIECWKDKNGQSYSMMPIYKELGEDDFEIAGFIDDFGDEYWYKEYGKCAYHQSENGAYYCDKL